MLRAPFSLPVLLLAATGHAAGPVVSHYLDENTNRQAIVTEGSGKVTVVIRFNFGYGVFGRWYGEGNRKDKEITFAAPVGEGQAMGTVFIAKASESKFEVAFKPGQKTPQDANINGTYRRVSDEKRLSIARKESALADDALAQVLKTTPRTWPGEDRPVAAEWKSRWPTLRNRWMSIVYKPDNPAAAPATKPATSTLPALGAKPAEPAAPAPSAEYWNALAETTGMGLSFINQPLDKVIPGWDGEYDDSFGGRVSVRMGNDKYLRFTLNYARGPDGMAGEIFGRIPISELTKEKNGDITASYTHSDLELKPGDQKAVVKFRKAGHFLIVDTQYAERYSPRAWFDGIYRWGPVPKE